MGTGDRMRFTKSDRERGYGQQRLDGTAVSGDSVTLSDGQQTRVIRLARSGQSNILTWLMPSPPTVAGGASENLAIARLKARKVTGN